MASCVVQDITEYDGEKLSTGNTSLPSCLPILTKGIHRVLEQLHSDQLDDVNMLPTEIES